jgi:integrase
MTTTQGRVRPKTKADGTLVYVADYKDPRTGKRKQREAPSEDAAWALIDIAYGRQADPTAGPCAGYPLGQAMRALVVRSEGMACEGSMAYKCRQVVSYFGATTPLESITFHMVEEWMRHLRVKQGNKESTIREKWQVLKQARRYALDRGDVKELGPYPPGPKVNNRKERVFSDEERQLFVGWLEQRYPDSGAILELMFETCSRFAQINRITPRWVQIDSEQPASESTLTFPGEIEKNKRPRTIPLTAKAVAVLQEQMEGKGLDEPIFGIPYDRHKWRLRAAKAALGISDPQLTGHCARHTAATRLAEANINQGLLMAFGGWSNLSSVQRYMHASTSSLKVARDALADASPIGN